MNELLAPLYLLMKAQGAGLGAIFNCFYSLMKKFMAPIYDDKEFDGLRVIFRVFRLLLLYHDPLLVFSVEQQGIMVDLFCTSWFLTLCARKAALSSVLCLWDYYLIDDDPFFQYFIAVSLLVEHREEILSTQASDLPLLLTNLSIDKQSMLHLLARSRLLRSRTPMSVRSQLFDLCFKFPLVPKASSSSSSNKRTVEPLDSSARSNHLYLTASNLEKLPCLALDPSELLSQSTTDHLIKPITIDCRLEPLYLSGHLPTSVHVSPLVLYDGEKLHDFLKTLIPLKGCSRSAFFLFLSCCLDSLFFVARVQVATCA
jgi:hypothetical protein